ncbi:MAG: MBL fold metallo-hydrolase [Clostridia bacterium]|nr:MBL fold metallo-hydrolase [Clostridia bacterium]
MKKIVSLLIAFALLSMASGALAASDSFKINADTAYTKYGWVTTAATADDSHHVTVGVTLAGETAETTYTTAVPMDLYNDQSYVYESQALVELLIPNAFVEILFNANDEVIDFERIERGAESRIEYYLDSMKYGGELTAPGGGPGDMVAQGWIMDASETTITVGDGNHVANVFEETYTFADDVKIYLVNNPGVDAEGNEIAGDWASEPATAADIQLCEKNADGEVYDIATRRTAVAIFDESAVDPETKLTREDVSSARVRELYLYKNLIKVSSTVAPDDVGYNGTSWMPGQDKTTGKTSAGWNGISTPFEVMTDRLYSLGDGYTCIFLFVSDPDENGKKTLTELDTGNAVACYGYWLNMEKMGYDPRALDNVLLTHGHGDHYQGLYELSTMVNRAAGYDKLNVATSGANQSGYLNGVYAGITLTANPERFVVDKFNEWETWIDYGEGVSVYPISTAGHTNDTASFIFRLTSTPEDKYFSRKSDTPVTTAWVYMGGYGGGAATKASNGYTRLQYKYSMQYLQSVIVPFAQSVSDYIYNIPQHGDQAPWYEVAKAVRMKQAEGEDILFLDAWNEGSEGIINLFEKRLSAYTYQWMNSAWKETSATNGDVLYDLYDQTIVPYIREAGYNWYCTPQNVNTEALEVSGPWKRQADTYEITVKDILVLHGFDAFQNKNEALAGIKTIYNWDISNGLSVDRDSYSHDPNGWYVQLVVDVDDDYAGGVYFTEQDAADMAKLDNRSEAYPVNWYVSEGNTYVDYENNAVEPQSGPVEAFIGADWSEILRTQRLNTQEEAQALADYIRQNVDAGNATFSVKLNNAGDILLPEGYVSAANAPLDDPFLNSLDDDSIKVTFPGTGYYSLEEEPLVIEKCVELNKAAGIDLTTMFVPVSR